MAKYYPGRKILITGAASGLGRLCAHKMGSLGAELILVDINAQGLKQEEQELKQRGISCSSYACNMGDFKEIESMAVQVLTDHEFVDTLINCAGIVTGKPMGHFTMEEAQLSMQVNTLGPMALIRAFYPSMEERNQGHIVNIASAAGLIGCANLTDYCATKFGIFGFNEALRVELWRKKLKIKTTVICPFFIDTGMFHGVKTRVPFLLPILKEEKVARRIVKAVGRQQKQLFMPPIVYMIPLLRVLSPAVLDGLATLLGVNHTMDEFVGRQQD